LYAHLRAENGRDHGREHEVHRAKVVSASHVRLGAIERGDEDDRRQFRARPLPDQLRGFEAVHARHSHVEQDHGEVLLQQLPQGIWAGGRLDHVLAQRGQDGSEREPFRRVIVDEEDVDLRLDGRGSRCRHHALSNHLTFLNTLTRSRTWW
jgi:hypothetical protein